MPQLRVAGQEIVEIDRLMRPVEGADAEMDDARRHRARIVGGPADRLGQAGQHFKRETFFGTQWNTLGSHREIAGT